MATTKEDIRRWLAEGAAEGATHTVVCCDSFDYSDYPVHVGAEEDVHEVIKAHTGDMAHVMEVYSYALPLEDQLAEHRAWHLEDTPPIDAPAEPPTDTPPSRISTLAE